MGKESKLKRAAIKGDSAKITRLLDGGADASASDKNGITALYVAAADGHLEVAAVLLERGAFVDAPDSFGTTPLHRAAATGNIEMVELLMSKGADVNAVTREDWTPLHIAARAGQAPTGELFLARGADVNARTKDGWTPPAYRHDVGVHRHDRTPHQERRRRVRVFSSGDRSACIPADSVGAHPGVSHTVSSCSPTARPRWQQVTCLTPGKKMLAERSMYWNSRGAGTDTIGAFGD